MAGIGHNRGPGTGRQRHCWKRSRAALLNNKLPLQVIRSRVRRAEALGLSYPQYASALMGAGRDIVGFLFTCDALGLRLRRSLEVPPHVSAKLARVHGARLTVFAPEAEPPGPFRAELETASGVVWHGAGPPPGPRDGWGAARAAVREILDPLGMPGKAVILVGSRDRDEAWSAAAGMAKYLAREAYFGSG